MQDLLENDVAPRLGLWGSMSTAQQLKIERDVGSNRFESDASSGTGPVPVTFLKAALVSAASRCQSSCSGFVLDVYVQLHDHPERETSESSHGRALLLPSTANSSADLDTCRREIVWQQMKAAEVVRREEQMVDELNHDFSGGTQSRLPNPYPPFKLVVQGEEPPVFHQGDDDQSVRISARPLWIYSASEKATRDNIDPAASLKAELNSLEPFQEDFVERSVQLTKRMAALRT
eukprot:2747099-Prymnesium_polylepis.1